MNSKDRIDARTLKEAFRWVVELTDSQDTDSLLPAGFAEWLASSERHRAAFVEAERVSRGLNSVDPQHRIHVGKILPRAIDTVVVPFPMRHAEPGPEIGQQSARRMNGWAWAACASALVLLAFPYGVGVLNASAVTYRSGVGQRLFVPLEDGSTVELNTNTRVDVRYGTRLREVRLLNGEASFDVRHDPQRPFRVITSAAEIQDVGTRFDVYRHPDGTTTVTVLEGRVVVGAAGRRATIDADEVATVGAHARAARTIDLERVLDEEVQRRMSWQTGMLEFHGQTLAEVVREINRYNVRQLVIADPSIANLRLGGRCRGEDLESFVALLGVLFDVRAVPSRDDPNVIELRRGSERR